MSFFHRSLVVGMLVLGGATSLPTNIQAQGPRQEIFMPYLHNDPVDVSATSVQSPDADINPCRVVGGWVGEIWCAVMYISLLQVQHDINNPPPTPTPTPTPQPTPTPEGTFTLPPVQGTETVEPKEECKFQTMWYHCRIQVKFPEINTTVCPMLVSVLLLYNDDSYKDARVQIDDFWPGENGVLWLEFYRVMYDNPVGLKPENYTATATCTN